MTVRRAVALAPLAALVLGAGPARAAGVTLYAGGRIAAHATPPAQFVRVATSADHRFVTLTADFLLPCRGDAGDPVYSPARALRVAVHRGRFAGSAPVHSSGSAGRADGAFAFTGHRVSPRVLAGTVRERATVRLGGRTEPCDTGQVAWRATRPARLRPAGNAVPGRALYGVTGAGTPFLLRAARDGQTASVAFEWRARCRGGGTVASDAELGGVTLAIDLLDGTARTRGRLPGGGVETTVLTVTGVIGKGVGAGQVRVAVRDVVHGRTTRTCRSGAVPWRALR